MKSDILELHEELLNHLCFYFYLTVLIETLYKDKHAFLHISHA
jgi:hypothetical protein